MSHPDIRSSVEELPCRSDDLSSFPCERYRQRASMNQPDAQSPLKRAEAMVTGLDDVTVMSQPVEQRGGQLGVSEPASFRIWRTTPT
jgi:hypothetical protein